MKKGDVFYRLARIESFNATDDSGPIRAALSSETPVQMFGRTEILDHSRAAVNMSEVGPSGLPMTVGHSERDPFSDKLPIGRARNLSLEDGRLRADLDFDMGDEAAAAVRGKVSRGVAPDVSLTYRVDDYTQTGDSTVTITRWTPLVASIVTLPADASVGAGRSMELANEDSNVEDTTETPAKESNIIADLEARKSAGFSQGADEGRKQVGAIMSRGLEIKRLRPDMASEVDELMVAVCDEDGATVSRFNELALDLIMPAATPLAKEGPAIKMPTVSNGRPSIEMGHDARDIAHRGMCLAMLERSVPRAVKAEEMQGNQYRGWPLVDVAREILTLSGHDVRGKSSEQIAKMAIGMRAISPGTAAYDTTDFPGLTENIGYKAALDGFDNADRTWDRWCGVGSTPDFKQFSIPRLSQTSQLPVVAENAAYQNLTRVDEREYGTAVKKGGLISFSWESVVNNDVNSFADQMQSSGEAAQATLDTDAWTVLTTGQIAGASGPVMRDTNQLFSAAHSNVITDALSLAGINAMRVLMGRQVDDNSEAIAPRLTYVMVPLELEDTANDLAGSEFLVDAGGAAQRANTVRNSFEVVPTHQLSDITDWFGASRKGQHVNVYFLNGQQSPTLEQESGWDTDAVHYKVRIVYTAVPRDWRGLGWAEVA